MDTIDRRTAITTIAATAGFSLAGCLGDDDEISGDITIEADDIEISDTEVTTTEQLGTEFLVVRATIQNNGDETFPVNTENSQFYSSDGAEIETGGGCKNVDGGQSHRGDLIGTPAVDEVASYDITITEGDGGFACD